MPFHFYYSWSVSFLYRTLSLPLLSRFPSAFPLFSPIVPSTPSPTTPVSCDCACAHDSWPQHSWGHEACLSPYHHLLPPPSSTPQSRLTCDQAYAVRHSLSRAHSGIARRNTKSRLNSLILQYLGSSQITTRSLDLLGNLRTFLLWLRSLLGSLRIYQDHLRIYLTHPWY